MVGCLEMDKWLTTQKHQDMIPLERLGYLECVPVIHDYKLVFCLKSH